MGLTIELWNRGMLWDKLLGVSWLPLMQINHSLPGRVIKKLVLKLKQKMAIKINIMYEKTKKKDDENDICISLDSELCLRDGCIVGTQVPTGIYYESSVLFCSLSAQHKYSSKRILACIRVKKANQKYFSILYFVLWDWG